MNKLSKTAKLLSLALAILFWFLLLRGLMYGAFSLRSCIALLGEPDQYSTTTINGITQGFLSIYSDNGIEVTRQSLLYENLLSLLVTLVQTPVFCYGLHLLRKLLTPIACQRPFSGTSKILKRMGWVSVTMAVIQNLSDFGLVWLCEYILPVSRMFEGSSITEIHFHYEPDGTYLILAVVLFILSAVFRYGEELQQLSDETL